MDAAEKMRDRNVGSSWRAPAPLRGENEGIAEKMRKRDMNTAGHTSGSSDNSIGLPSRRFSEGASVHRFIAGERPAGYAALMERYGIDDYQPPHMSYVHPKAFATRTREEAAHGRGIREIFPGRTVVGESDAEHLAFAMRYDGVDLEIIRRVRECGYSAWHSGLIRRFTRSRMRTMSSARMNRVVR